MGLRVGSGSGTTRSFWDEMASSFAAGFEDPTSLLIASSTASRCGSASDSSLAENVWDRELDRFAMDREAVGVLAGEDLVGEMDLARSKRLIISHEAEQVDISHERPDVWKGTHTSPPSLSLCTALHNLLFQLPVALLILLVVSVAQLLDALQEIVDIFRAIGCRLCGHIGGNVGNF